MNCHNVMMECLEQLLMEKFLSQKDHDYLLESLPGETQRKLKELVDSLSVDSLNTVITDEGLIIFLDEYITHNSERMLQMVRLAKQHSSGYPTWTTYGLLSHCLKQ